MSNPTSIIQLPPLTSHRPPPPPMASAATVLLQSSPAQPLILQVEEEEEDGERKSKFRVRNLTKVSESGEAILRGVNVDVPRGAIVGVIGPSGSGKSTLLRVLNRLWEPPSGTVYLDGTDIRDLDVLGLRRKVGMLFQLPVLFEGTVADNIRYGPQLMGMKLTDSEVFKLLTLADLDSSFMKKTGGELSVGQAQRVALARTLANEPEVLLLDEPTSALDPISTQNIEDVIVKLKKSRGMTIVMVSHSIKQIQRIADIVCLLVDGQIIEVLQPDKLSEAKHPMALSRTAQSSQGDCVAVSPPEPPYLCHTASRCPFYSPTSLLETLSKNPTATRARHRYDHATASALQRPGSSPRSPAPTQPSPSPAPAKPAMLCCFNKLERVPGTGRILKFRIKCICIGSSW